MMQRTLIFLLFIIIVGGDRLYCQTAATNKPTSLFEPRVLQSDEQKIVIEINVPPMRILSAGMSQSDGQLLSLSGYSLSAEPGAPQLPLRGLTIGVPENARPTLQILDQDTELHAAKNIQPAPTIIYDRTLAADGISIESNPQAHYVYEKNAAIYERNAFYPSAPVQLGDPAIMRGHRLLPVQVYPILANPVNGRLKYFKKVRFAIYFNAPATAPRPTTATEDKYFDPVFQATVLNYETAKNWKLGRDKSLRKSANNSSYFLDQGSEWYKIMTDKPGIFKVDKAALDAAGLNTSSIDPRNLKMFNRGVEVAIYISGEDDGSFDSGDYIEFFADKFKNYYTETNIYWLTLASSAGKRMTVVDGAITGTNPVLTRGKELYHYEKDIGHRADYPGHTDNTKWWHTAIIAPETETHTIDIGAVSDTLANDCSFWIKGQGMTGTDTNPDHHTQVEINGNQLFDEYWDGRVLFSRKDSFPQSWLVEGGNNIDLIGPGDTGSSIDYLYIDFLEIEYWRDYMAVNDSIYFSASGSGANSMHLRGFGAGSDISLFDVSDSTNVKRVTNFQRLDDSLRFQYNVQGMNHFIAVAASAMNQPTQIVKDQNSDLRSSRQVDYIVIAYDDFIGEAQRLAAYRESQGLATVVVTTQNVYDEFNDGFYDAYAIKSFLNYAYNNWASPAPVYVVLLGDASWNPTILNPGSYGDEKSDYTPTRLFEAVEDNFEAASDSWFAQIEGNDVLPEMFIGRLSARTIDEAEAQVNKIINYETDFTAGLWNRTATFCADNGEGGVLAFEDTSDALINDLIPKSFTVKKVYLQQLGTEGARTATKNAFDDGTLIMNYYGHGSSFAWAAEGFFMRDDVPDLRNDNKAPFIVTLSCINGYFVNPKDADKCLGETLERERQRGSIGIFTGAGEAYPSPVLALGRKIWGSLFQDQNKTLGPLTNAGIVDMFSRYPDSWDHAMFYILFGDPATTLHYQPSINFASGGFEGAVLANGEPPAIGATLLAVRDSGVVAHYVITDKKGAFGPLYIDADDPNTPLKDGAVDGDSIRFSLARAGQDTMRLYPAAAWKSGEVQKISLSNFPTRVESANLDIVLYVDDKKVGDGVYDGEVISKKSVIAAKIRSDAAFLDVSSIRVRLNRALLDPDQYSIAPDKDDPHHSGFLRFQPATLADGEYEIVVEAVNSGALHVVSQKSFAFAIQSKLALSDVVNFPNPMQKETRFTYNLANDASADVQIKIYTVAGRLIKSIDAVGRVSYNEVYWDGLDAYGDELANGVYFYKISARDGDETCEKIERLVVMH